MKNMNKYVPHKFNDKQKNRRFEVAFYLLLRNTKDPVLHLIVTCDEKQILWDNRRYWRNGWTSMKPQNTFKTKFTPKKVMVTVWQSITWLINHNFLNPGETIFAQKYCQEIKKYIKTATYLSGNDHQKKQRTSTCRTNNAAEIKRVGIEILLIPHTHQIFR